MMASPDRCCLVCQRSFVRPRFGKGEGTRGLCPRCGMMLAWLDGVRCDRCDKPMVHREHSGDAGPICCADCLAWSDIWFAKNRSGVAYQGIIKTLLYEYKYRGRHGAVYVLFDILRRVYEREASFQQVEGVTYVPLHADRLRERGFNQAEELARLVARWANKPLLHGLVRQTPTGKLSKMGRRERLAAMQGAFEAGIKTAVTRWTRLGSEATVFADHTVWRGRHILLIDDIYTTGGTVNDCSRALLVSGVQSVQVLTVARAV